MKEALKLALDVLNESWHLTPKPDYVRVAITAIEAALADSWGYRICEFCGCHTNAKARACCDAGRDADKALAQQDRVAEPAPSQEPVAWLTKDKFSNKVDLDEKNAKETTGWSAAFPVYTTPQQRPWVGLTEAQFLEATRLAENGNYLVAFVRIQEWLKEQNNG